MALEHVDIEWRATVVMALTAHKQGLELAKRESGPIKLFGARIQNVKREIARADDMIKAFTNKWVYLSDEVLDLSKYYKEELVKLPEWVQALKQLQEYAKNAVVLEDGGTAVDYPKTELLRKLVSEMTAGGSL